MQGFSNGSSPILSMPPQVQRKLMGSLVMCAMGEKKKEFLTQVRIRVCACMCVHVCMCVCMHPQCVNKFSQLYFDICGYQYFTKGM